MAMSLTQGGTAPKFLSPSTAWYLANGLEGLTPTIEELPDSDMCEVWQEVCFPLDYSN